MNQLKPALVRQRRSSSSLLVTWDRTGRERVFKIVIGCHGGAPRVSLCSQGQGVGSYFDGFQQTHPVLRVMYSSLLSCYICIRGRCGFPLIS